VLSAFTERQPALFVEHLPLKIDIREAVNIAGLLHTSPAAAKASEALLGWKSTGLERIADGV
jgi:hypothetical protein